MSDNSVNGPNHGEKEGTKNAFEPYSSQSLRELRGAVSCAPVFDLGSEQIAMSKGKADASTETYPSGKQSLSDLIQAIKTDPEIKRLLNDALAENKSPATNVTPGSLPGPPADFAQQVSTTETSAPEGFLSGESGACQHAACALDNCDTCKFANGTSRQNEHAGDWQDVAESAATPVETWTPYQPIAPAFDSWTSRLSCPTNLVVVKDVKYTIHDTIFDTMFPAYTKATKLDRLDDGSFLVSGIENKNFASALEFMYSQDMKHLRCIPVEGQHQIFAFAAECDNNCLLSMMMIILELDFSTPGFSRRAAKIYRSWGPMEEFRQYFRQTLKTELQSRLDDGICEGFLNEIHFQFSDAGLALLDVALVLNSLWTTAELKVEHDYPAEDWGDGDHGQEDADNHDNEDHTSSTCGENMIGPDYNDSWGACPPRPYHWSSGWETSSQSDGHPQPPCVATKSKLHTAKAPAPSIIAPPANIVAEAPQQRNPSPDFASWEEPIAQPLREEISDWPIDNTQADWKATALQSTSALARCVHHHLKHRDMGTATTVAEDLGCTKDEADRALQELMLVGVVNSVFRSGEPMGFCVKQEMPQKPVTTALPANNVAETEEHERTRAAPLPLETTTDETRSVYHWLKGEQQGWPKEKWFSAEHVSDGIGCSFSKAIVGLLELQITGRAAVRRGAWGVPEFRLYSSELGH
ncbi:hypothetical protein G647_03735 [Cladophialophora carrionii CBS 160.54]|uniref:Uncharacterized protein n=1 Tax=Cladophialophora carrionii CBS 160.54 TaxID=1279043 RepID=V9DCH2_9EURO|nr:uncharacterized protein G647_03735 [Cladophialophora carrionii CBS 160.54]ETI24366.1 hypothetical protein G647_03735 [Cladophialophora carrionii CBS 160.54]